MRQGQGWMTYANGVHLRGGWSKNRPGGDHEGVKCTLIYGNGDFYEGLWQQGEMVGKQKFGDENGKTK